MPLNRIEDWDKILEPPKQRSDKPTKPFVKLDRNTTSQAALNGDHWNENMLKLVGSWVSKGNTNEEIQNLAAPHTLPDYTAEQTQKEIQRMIDGARRKGFDSTGEVQQGGSYLTLGREFHFMDSSRAKPIDIRLSNFIAEIVFETTKVDGRDSVKTFTVQGHMNNGAPLPLVEIDAGGFDKLDWLTQSWGAKAQITVGPRHKDHVAAAIKSCSQPIVKVISRHTGWIKDAGKHIYLSASGGITANGLNTEKETELQGILGSYDLPSPSKNGAMDFTQNLTQFEKLIDGGIGLLLVGASFRSVLSEFEPCTVSIFLQGTTGTFKSAIAGCLQALFGKKFHGAHLPENWSSTGNAIEKKAFLAKDAVFTIDDFVARGTPSEVSRSHRDAERVLRAQGNQSGRDRLTSTTEIRGAYMPRGLILATGEDIPNGHSLQARCVIISINKGAVDTATLTALQEAADSGQLSQMMADFIMWIAEKADEGKIKKHLTRVHAECKELLVNKGHTRMRDNLATLLSGLWLLLEFGKEQNILSDENIKHFKSKALSAAQDLAHLQVSVDQDGSEAERFITLLQSALSMSRAHVIEINGNSPSHCESLGWKWFGSGDNHKCDGQGPKIGWVTDYYVYIDIKAALIVIKPLSTQIGNYLGSSERAIKKALLEAGMLVKYDQGRTTTKVTVEGIRKNLLCLRLSLILDVDLIPTQRATTIELTVDDIPF
jgi:hypothetical protein